MFPSSTSESHTYNPEVKKTQINGVIITGCILVSILPITGAAHICEVAVII